MAGLRPELWRRGAAFMIFAGTATAAAAAPSQYKVVAYYPNWASYGPTSGTLAGKDFVNPPYRIKDLVESGAYNKINYLVYAFADIEYEQSTANPPVAPGPAHTYTCALSDPGADKDTKYNSLAQTVVDHRRPLTDDGQSDVSANGTVNAAPVPGVYGNLGQLFRMKKWYGGPKILIAIGGWTGTGAPNGIYKVDASKTGATYVDGLYPVGGSQHVSVFSYAADDAHRQAFVKSCVDLFIKGKLPGQENQVVGSLYGLFDGIDIDWEYPGVVGYGGYDRDNDGDPDDNGRPEDKANFTKLLAEFRRQLDAADAELKATVDAQGKPLRPAQVGPFTLSAAVPAASTLLGNIEGREIHQYLNFLSVMAYDLHGPWDKITDLVAPLYPRDDQDKESGHDAVQAYVGCNGCAPREKVLLGVPFYGRGFTNVGSTADGGILAESPDLAWARGAGLEFTKADRNQSWGYPEPEGDVDSDGDPAIDGHLSGIGVSQYEHLQVYENPKDGSARQLPEQEPYTKYPICTGRDRWFCTHERAGVWVFNNDELWTYDDRTTLFKKMRYVRDQGLGGAMVWSLDHDARNANKAYDHPLLKAVWRSFLVTGIDCPPNYPPMCWIGAGY